MLATIAKADAEDPDNDLGLEPEPIDIANRIVDFKRAVDPAELRPNPLNPRIHPQQQRSVIRGVLQEIGWIGAALVNVRTGRLIDGHDRRDHALQMGSTIPVIYVDLSEEEERKALATFDPITSMAMFDESKLNDLLQELTTNSEPVASLLADLQIETTPSFENKGQTGDRQMERATICRIAIHVEDVKTVERAIAQTGVEDRGTALLYLCRHYLQTLPEEQQAGNVDKSPGV